MFSSSSSLFPPNQPTATGSSLFNIPNLSTQQQQSQQQPIVTLASHPFQYIYQSFDPNSLGYRFRAIFYNLLPSEQQSCITTLQRPPLVSESLWNQALMDNPDQRCCIPIIANGFEDLISRSSWQKETQNAYQTKTNELSQRIQALQGSQSIQGLKRLKERQGKLAERLLRVQSKLEPLKKAGIKLDRTELSLAQRISDTHAKLSEQADIGGVAAQLEMLLKDSRIDFNGQIKEREVTDPDAVRELAELLNSHSETLIKALDVVVNMNRSLDTINTGYSI
jgi:hypothetical protein